MWMRVKRPAETMVISNTFVLFRTLDLPLGSSYLGVGLGENQTPHGV